MNVEKVKKCLYEKVDVNRHKDLMKDIDIGWSVVHWEDVLTDCAEDYDSSKVHMAIHSYVDIVLDTFWGEVLEDLEDVWTSRKTIKKDFIDEYEKVFAFLLSNDAFCKDDMSKTYDSFVKFKQKFNDCLMEWVCDDNF